MSASPEARQDNTAASEAEPRRGVRGSLTRSFASYHSRDASR